MAGRRLSLLRPFQKKKEGPGASPFQHPAQMEQSLPLQEDPGRHRTQEQDRAHDRFRRAAQGFLKFLGIRRKRTTTRLTRAMAQLDLRLTELEMKPDVSTALTDGTGNCDTPPIVHTAESDPALTDDTTDTDTSPIDRAATSDIALTNEPANSDISLPDLTVEADTATTEGIADPDLMPRESVNYAPTPDLFEENGVSSPKQVPAFVRNMQQALTGNGSPEEELLTQFLRVTKAYPADVVVTLLRCAPSCDGAAASMWRTITSSEMALEKVLPELLCVMEDWPVHSTSTSDGDNTPVFALAATIVVWEILQMSRCPEQLQNYSPHLLVDLLFQVFTSKEQMPEEVDTFWKGYWEQHGLPTDSKRFAVLTIKALLCHLECEAVVVSMERKCGWDTLLRPDTHHYAVGLLAREMRRASSPLYSWIAPCLLELLSREKPRWELPAMAFLVEVLDCLDMTKWSDSFLEILARHLRSECPEMRRLALRGLVVLSKDPVMADGMRTLTQSLMDVLRDEDRELIGMALSIIINEVQNRAILISTPTALQLAEVLQPLFGYDNIRVQLLSIHLFRKVMELRADEGKQHLKTQVTQSLLPLFFCWHDENQHVAEASWKALLRAAWFLKRRDLAELLETEQPQRFSECLLEKDKSRVAEYLCQALPYLESPQEPVREAALRFIGIAAGYLRGQYQELQLIIDALQATRDDRSPAVSELALETINLVTSVQRAPYPRFQQLQDQLCRAWNTRPSLWGCVRLCCCSWEES